MSFKGQFHILEYWNETGFEDLTGHC